MICFSGKSVFIGACFHSKWCHKVFGMNSPEIDFFLEKKNQQNKTSQQNHNLFLCSARVPFSKLAIIERIFLLIVLSTGESTCFFSCLLEASVHSTNTSIVSVLENKQTFIK